MQFQPCLENFMSESKKTPEDVAADAAEPAADPVVDAQSEENVSATDTDSPMQNTDQEAADSAEPSPSLEEQLEAEKARANENYDKFVRANAEMDNLRKRVERDVANAHKYALEKFSKDLLAVRDSLELGLAAAQKKAEANPDDEELVSVIQGVEMTGKMLADVMSRYNIEQIDPTGEAFNPDQHEAMAMQESDQAPNTVITTMQKGYSLNGRLLRPAMVVVAKAAE